MHTRLLILIALTLVGLASCDAPVPEGSYEGIDACSDLALRDAVYFNDVMLPDFFEPYCVACHSSEREGFDRHGAPDHIDFDDFDSATSVNSLAWSQVTSREMPPMGRTPSTAELELLLDWLNCTAPVADYDVAEELADECPDPLLTWADAGQAFADNCTRCHDSALVGADRNGAPESANYDSAAGVLSVGDALVWQRIHDGEMPPDADPVPQDEAEVIWAWLSCGGPE